MTRISKANAKNIQYLLSFLLPEHAGSRPLADRAMPKVAGDLADLTAPIAGTSLNGVQVDLEWNHYRPAVLSRAELDQLRADLAAVWALVKQWENADITSQELRELVAIRDRQPTDAPES